MKMLYIDTPMGISGDMFMAGMIDLGVDFKAVLKELKKLPIDKIDISITKEARHSISATCFRVKNTESRHHRTFKDIKGLIKKSALSADVKKISTATFKTIAEAEGKIHGISADKVHFHEVGAMDSIIDIVGSAIAVTALKPDIIIASPIPLGSGWATTMHGTLPVPAPATLEILRGVPIASSNAPFELTTPTGAAIIKTLATGFGPLPAMTIERVGYGAGKKDFKEKANVLRAVIGAPNTEGEHAYARSGQNTIKIIETNIDDMTPQTAGYLMERLFVAGALDAYITPVQMKKSRPGILITALCKEASAEKLVDIIFSESTSIGIRTHAVERLCLERKIISVPTPYGKIRVKVSYLDSKAVNIQPEYDDCRINAIKKNVPLRAVTEAALSAAKIKKLRCDTI